MAMPASGRTRGLDLLVVGHLNLDAEVRVPFLPGSDRTVPVLHRKLSLGGTAANISRWSRRLGLRVALSAFVGPDLPPEFARRLRTEGVELRELVARPEEFTPVCWIFEDGRGHQLTVIDQGAMRDTSREALPLRSLREARVVHLTTGDPLYQLRTARAAHQQGKVVAFDPAQEVHYRWSAKDLREMLSLSEMLFVNEAECAQAQRLARASRPEDLLGQVPLVVVTRGARGARAYSREGRLDVPAARVKRFHRVTGAGDAFRGGFYRGWFAGEPLDRCLTWGCAAGAAAVDAPPDSDGSLPSARSIAQRVGSRRRSP